MMAVLEETLERDPRILRRGGGSGAPAAGRSGRLRGAADAPTRSACSRWRAARRCPACRACGPQRFYDIVVQVAIIRPGPIVGKMVHPYLQAAAGTRAGRTACTPRSSPCCARTLGRAAVSGAVAAHGHDRRRLHRRRGRGAAPRLGLQALGEAHEGDRGAAARRHGAQRHHGRGAGHASSSPSRPSRSTDFPNRTPPASR